MGLRQFSVWRGRLFKRSAIESSATWSWTERSVPFGSICRSSPLVFSQLPLGQQHQTGGSLDQNAYGGLVGGPSDQIALPVARHHPIRHLWRPQVDADHL